MGDAALVQGLQMIQTTYYVNVVMGALVAYDQVYLAQVDLIWNETSKNRKWSFMTVLYVIARYCGSLSAIAAAVFGHIRLARHNCYLDDFLINPNLQIDVNIFLVVNWTGNIFLPTMQAILAIRVYTLFNRSRKVLIFLATLYVPQAIIVFVVAGSLFNDRAAHRQLVIVGPAYGNIQQLADIESSAALLLAQDSTILCVVFDSVLMFFALWAVVRHALEEKTLHGGWSVNVLVRALVADHLGYFVCYLIWMSLSLATDDVTEPGILGEILNNVYNIFTAFVVVAGPRMVISLRAIESKSRGEGGTLEGEVSTIRFGIQEPPTQSESVIEQGGAPSSG
ncbi:hypothetical protein BJ138DRAFT_1103739 [Hygrophoropsis aurantiaca]|uniref:Uncharacterized protein n=1 Tax=Hygrophoropsis aurantiaca TaxID=72124 RepID=A0ACB8A519_9AGAM|nr:hypothetical protein BJ138DRAFT_1103739 [Hygrophoropsis aurantiaca]